MSKSIGSDTIEQNKLEDINVLIVDDQADIRQGLKRLISALNCDIDTANSAESALDILTDKNYDMVFLDIKMGGMSGIDLLNLHSSSLCKRRRKNTRRSLQYADYREKRVS